MTVALFILLALFAPTQLPTSAQQAWFGTTLLHIDPYASGLRYLGKLVVNARGVTDDLSWFVGPVVAALLVTGVAVVVGRRLSVTGGTAS